MISKRQLFNLQFSDNELREHKAEKGLIGKEDENGQAIAHINEMHLGRWGKKWMRFC